MEREYFRTIQVAISVNQSEPSIAKKKKEKKTVVKYAAGTFKGMINNAICVKTLNELFIYIYHSLLKRWIY